MLISDEQTDLIKTSYLVPKLGYRTLTLIGQCQMSNSSKLLLYTENNATWVIFTYFFKERFYKIYNCGYMKYLKYLN